jgi:ABC-type polysaccharide/polyol phosphate export permease
MSTEIETGPDQPDAATKVVERPVDGDGRRGGRHVEDEFHTELHVYEPHRVGLPPIGPYAREVWNRREFAFELSRMKLRSQHFNTAFGQLWLVLNPLMLAGVYFVLVDILRAGHKQPGFFAHLVAGIFAYYFVSGAVRDGVRSIVGGGKLVLNTAFPRALLPLSTVITAFKRFIPTFVIYIPIHIASGLPIGFNMLWAVPIMVLLGFIAAGLSMFVAALQVYFRDVKSFIPYVLRVWLYASPVLYFANEVPERWTWLLKVNPIGSLLTAWSDALQFNAAPDAADMAIGAAWAAFMFVAGALFFISRERDFAVRL